ncbi:MAG: hypothetical protein AB7F41_17180, partial [Methylocystis sp.]
MTRPSVIDAAQLAMRRSSPICGFNGRRDILGRRVYSHSLQYLPLPPIIYAIFVGAVFALFLL